MHCHCKVRLLPQKFMVCHSFPLPLPVADAPQQTAASSARADEDAALVNAVRRAEPWAAEALYRKIAPAVTRTLWRLGRDLPGDHDDMMQITFERIVNSIVEGTYRGACSLPRWATAIASHAVIDYQRVRRRERNVIEGDLDTLAHAGRSETVDAERSLIARSELENLRSTLSRMRPLDARALVLCYGLGHSMSEAAELLEVSEAALASRLARARRELLRRVGKAKADERAASAAQ